MFQSWMFGRGADREKTQQEQDQEEERFRVSMEEPGKFEDALDVVDEADESTAIALLGCACLTERSPEIIRKIGARCSNLSAHALHGVPPLNLAAQVGHVSGVRELLRLGADVNVKSREGFEITALHAAAYSGHLDCVEALLETSEIDVDLTNPTGDTALYACVVAAHEHRGKIPEDVFASIAAALVARGADVHKVSEATPLDPSASPLLSAIEYDLVAIVRELVEAGTKPPVVAGVPLLEIMKVEELSTGMLDVLIEAGWYSPRFLDDAAAAAAASMSDIIDVLQASPSPPSRAFSQRSSVGTPPRLESYLLHSAAREGNAALVRELLTSGTDPNGVDAVGATALHVAVDGGHEDVVEALVRAAGIEVDAPDGGKKTALFRAATSDRAWAVNALLEAGASVAEAKTPGGQSVLHRVAAKPAGAVLEALLKAGALEASSGRKGYTPLHVACEHVGAHGTVETLLRAGALPGHCWNDDLRSPLLVACKNGNLEAVRLLLPKLSPRQINMSSSATAGAETPLVAAIRCLDHRREIAEIVEALLEGGADPGVRIQPSKVSALFAALLLTPESGGVSGGIAASSTIGPRVVRALVAAGANVNELSETLGLMPLHVACTEGACREVIEALLDLGADPLAPAASKCFLDPSQLATMAGHPGALQTMIERPHSGGVNVVAGSPPFECTYLFLAVQRGRTEVVRFLLEQGADMDLLSYEDGKPFQESLVQLAAANGHLDVMNLLIQAKRFKDRAEAEAVAVAEPEPGQQPVNRAERRDKECQ